MAVDEGFFEEYLSENDNEWRIGPSVVHSSNDAFLAILILQKPFLAGREDRENMAVDGSFVEEYFHQSLMHFNAAQNQD